MPEFIEDDVFRTIVPLNDGYSYDAGATQPTQTIPPSQYPVASEILPAGGETKRSVSEQEKEILAVIGKDPKISQRLIADTLGMNLNTLT